MIRQFWSFVPRIPAFVLCLFSLLLFSPTISMAQGPVIVTLADISGDGAVHAISASGTTVRWIQFRSLSTNSTASCSISAITGCVRVGDASISTSRGIFLMPGDGIPILESSGSVRIALNTVYYLVQSGDKISITYMK